MSRPAELGVVVVSHASAATIATCVGRLLSAAEVARVVVVDNASPDDTVARLAAFAGDARLTVVRNADNRGFGAACNQGASAIAAPWIAFVNPDAYVEADSLSRLVGHARGRPGAGLIGVELVDEQGVPDPASRRSDPRLAEMLRGALSGGRNLRLGRDPALALQPVDALSGALMLMPTGLFLQLGGFDEGYRLHAEDLDLCRRVREAGYEVLVANDIRVVHVRGVSSRRRPVWVEWHKHRGLWRYFRKFEGRAASWPLRALVFAAIWARFLVMLPRACWRAWRVRGTLDRLSASD